jgi:hypothetical protein
MMGSNRFRVDRPCYVELYLGGHLELDEMNLGAPPARAGVGRVLLTRQRYVHGETQT